MIKMLNAIDFGNCKTRLSPCNHCNCLRTKTGPISGSGSEAVSLPCPTRSLMLRYPRSLARCGRRSDRSTIPTRSILIRKGRIGVHSGTYGMLRLRCTFNGAPTSL